jgi:curved DNA-binding protein CbpA
MTPRDILLVAVKDATTAAIAWQFDKKKRTLFLEEGQLVFLYSNLKSESPERIAERFPELSPEEQKKRLYEARFRGFLQEKEGDVRIVPAPPPSKDSIDVFALLSACADLLPSLPEEAYPNVVTASLLQRIPLSPALRDYIWELDGTRDMEEVTSFAPAPPDATDRAFRVAFALGAINNAGKATTFSTAVVDPNSSAGTPIEVFPSGWETSRPQSSGKASTGLLGDDLFGNQVDLGLTPVRPVEDPIKKWFGGHHARIQSAENHFQLLGVAWDDSPDAMRKAYFALARDLHPDRFTDAPLAIQQTANELFDKIRAAWEVLGDDTARERYIGRVIRGEKSEEEQATERVQQILEGEGNFKRGVMELGAGRIAQAHDLFSSACTLVPEEPEFRAYKAYTSFRIQYGKDDEAAMTALEQIRDCLKEKESLDNVWVLLGMAQRVRGEDASARRAFIKALQLKPSNPDAVREMKRLEGVKGNEKPAEKAPDKAPGFFARLFGRK